MGRYLRLEQIASESMDILIPFFSELYSLSIRMPPLRAPVWKKRRNFSGQFRPEGRNGIIELNMQYCKTKASCGGTVAHEVGHAATYQHHSEFFILIEDKVKSFLYDSISEGIAMEFEKTGLEALLGAEWITEDSFEKEMRFYKKILSYIPVFTMGYTIVTFMKKKAGMKEIICSPERHFDAVMSKYGKKIIAAAEQEHGKSG